MWSQIRPTLYAGVLSCVLHILLLGLTASVLVVLPTHPVPQLRVTLLQRAIPLPTQEPQGTAIDSEPAAAAKVVPLETPRPKPLTPRPVAQKKSPSPAPLRSPKPVVTPRPEPLPIAKDEPPQVAFTVPPAETVPASDSGISTISAEITATTGEEKTHSDSFTAEDHLRGETLAGKTGNGGRGGLGAQGLGGISATPDYNINPKPPYPLIARRIGAQGEVLLRVLVRQDGSVAIVELAHSSGFSLLDESATRTVRDNWRFIPARLGGTPVESWVEVPSSLSWLTHELPALSLRDGLK